MEHAILLGAPVAIDPVKFQTARSVVAGRFINGFCVTDWLLALCSRCDVEQQGTSIGVSPQLFHIDSAK